MSIILGDEYKLWSINCQTFVLRLLYEIFMESAIKAKVDKIAAGKLGYKKVQDQVYRVG